MKAIFSLNIFGGTLMNSREFCRNASCFFGAVVFNYYTHTSAGPPPAPIANAWTILSSWARRICAGSCEPMPTITMTSDRIGRWTRMCQSLGPFSELEASVHARSLADFTTTTCGFRFSVHTGLKLRHSFQCNFKIIFSPTCPRFIRRAQLSPAPR